MKYTITYTEQVTYTATVEATSKEEALDQFNTESITEDNVVQTESIVTSIEEVS